MTLFDVHEYAVGERFAPAIINHDYSSLSSREVILLKKWCGFNSIGPGHWDGFGDKDHLGSRCCNITGIVSNCYVLRRLVIR